MTPRVALAPTLFLLFAVACSSTSPAAKVMGSPSTGDGDSLPMGEDAGPGHIIGDGDAPGDGDNSGGGSKPKCGNKILTKDEACDDGNTDDGDGCSPDCKKVAEGYLCVKPGDLCHPFARCGDKVLAFPEQCDDGNKNAGDGCSATCKVEIGWKCDDNSCSHTTCGDGKAEGAESCDDGNKRPLDGCSATCVAEPSCGSDGCSSACGDGVLLGSSEECDDGNTLKGDGCSDTCKKEPGYVCKADAQCEKGKDGKCILRVPAIFRDFAYHAPEDFESDCAGDFATTGIVKDRLSKGKPVATGSGDMCTDNLDEWYIDKPGTNVTFPSELVLYDDGKGSFVNRYGKNGEQFNTKVGCVLPAASCFFDGNPFFFPVDGIPGALDNGGETATVDSTVYGLDGAEYDEATETGSSPLHNFAFTSEVVYWFEFQKGKTATLDFNGDDDVWVFINERLALDLGGLHPAVGGSVTVSDTTAGGFGLKDGGVYEIKVFHAERHTKGSTFRLTLSGFATARSDCNAVCGDGILGAGEECDDGKNDGGYNECAPGCVLGPYCGDGIVQDGEDCDDGNRFDDDDCGSSCRKLVVL